MRSSFLGALRLQSKAIKLSGSSASLRIVPFTDDDGSKKTEITVYANGQQPVQIRRLWFLTGDPSDDKLKYPSNINDLLPITINPGHAKVFEANEDIRGWADWRGSRAVAVGVATGAGDVVFSHWVKCRELAP